MIVTDLCSIQVPFRRAGRDGRLRDGGAQARADERAGGHAAGEGHHTRVLRQ